MADATETTETYRDFTISRTFDAPRALVWRAWTEGERLDAWFGPKGMPVFTSKLEVRPGGVYHYGLQMPMGAAMWGLWRFSEVTPQERLVYISSFSDEDGNVARAPFPDFPLEVLSVVEFTEENGRTTISMRGTPVGASDAERRMFSDMFGSMTGGWTGTFDQLEAHLATSA